MGTTDTYTRLILEAVKTKAAPVLAQRQRDARKEEEDRLAEEARVSAEKREKEDLARALLLKLQEQAVEDEVRISASSETHGSILFRSDGSVRYATNLEGVERAKILWKNQEGLPDGPLEQNVIDVLNNIAMPNGIVVASDVR